MRVPGGRTRTGVDCTLVLQSDDFDVLKPVTVSA